jgi:hypothetical protein
MMRSILVNLCKIQSKTKHRFTNVAGSEMPQYIYKPPSGIEALLECAFDRRNREETCV